MARILAVCVGVGAFGPWVLGCSSMQSAAARDPMKCERDPSCARARESYADCTRQCVDAPECVRRCEQVQKQTDGLGR
jgi:hypothetical protein